MNVCLENGHLIARNVEENKFQKYYLMIFNYYDYIILFYIQYNTI
jgi:hypothetical protein